MPNRINYWSCSKFADYVRGTKSISYGTSEEWNDWEKTAKEKFPLRFWLADHLDDLQNAIFLPSDILNNIRYYIVNRWIEKSHALTAHKNHLKPGQYHEMDERYINCLFDSLIDFVEIEKAWMYYIGNPTKYKVPLWQKYKLLRFGKWSNKQAGIDYLKWEMTLVYDENWGMEPKDKSFGKLTEQAKSAKEVYELYTWWTEIYPNRLDPSDASGWSDYCEAKREAGYSLFSNEANKDKKLKDQCTKSLKLMRKIEKEYDEEDTRMLTRLIKIRKCLWT